MGKTSLIMSLVSEEFPAVVCIIISITVSGKMIVLTLLFATVSTVFGVSMDVFVIIGSL